MRHTSVLVRPNAVRRGTYVVVSAVTLVPLLPDPSVRPFLEESVVHVSGSPSLRSPIPPMSGPWGITLVCHSGLSLVQVGCSLNSNTTKSPEIDESSLHPRQTPETRPQETTLKTSRTSAPTLAPPVSLFLPSPLRSRVTVVSPPSARLVPTQGHHLHLHPCPSLPPTHPRPPLRRP